MRRTSLRGVILRLILCIIITLSLWSMYLSWWASLYVYSMKCVVTLCKQPGKQYWDKELIIVKNDLWTVDTNFALISYVHVGLTCLCRLRIRHELADNRPKPVFCHMWALCDLQTTFYMRKRKNGKKTWKSGTFRGKLSDIPQINISHYIIISSS